VLSADTQPLVSCVMCTRGRPEFLLKAIKIFNAQDYENRELLIAHDEDDHRSLAEVTAEWETVSAPYRPTRFLSFDVPTGTKLGAKMNMAIKKSSGLLIHKFDDDDYYGPGFLARAVRALQDSGAELVHWGRYLVRIDGRLRVASGLLAGGSLVFRRSLWERSPFRSAPRSIDGWFVADAGVPAHAIQDSPELFIYVRHGNNMSKELHGAGGPPVNVDNHLRGLPYYDRPDPARGTRVCACSVTAGHSPDCLCYGIPVLFPTEVVHA
jgi:glycosyltransferase involved in cell wall biosynthesis